MITAVIMPINYFLGKVLTEMERNLIINQYSTPLVCLVTHLFVFA